MRLTFIKSVLFAGTTAALVLTGCAQQHPLAGVGQPLLLPDGHSSEWLVSGAVCADPTCWTEDTVTGGVYTHYQNNHLVSEVHDLRPVTAPAAGYALAQVAVPATINAVGTAGAGALVARGIQLGDSYQAYGTYQGNVALGKAIATGDAALGKALSAHAH